MAEIKIVAEKKHWSVTIHHGSKIIVDLGNLVYTDQEVLEILDAYQKALYDVLRDQFKILAKG